MIDVHFHCLPGIDDGPSAWPDAVSLCRAAASEGTSTIVATPHVLREPWLNEDQTARDALITTLNGQLGDSPKVVAGCEYYFSADALELWALGRRGPLTGINGGPWLLVEFPAVTIPAMAESVFYELVLAGVRPLIAHPERNLVFASDPSRLRRFIDLGARAQLTAASVLGGFGKAALKAARGMIEDGLAQVVASDAHSAQRPPAMLRAREVVSHQWGAALAESLFERNPLAIVNGEDLPD